VTERAGGSARGVSGDSRPLTPDGFQAQTDVSRETLDRLATHIDLLQRWQKSINLVGPSTLADPWRRHVLDSWQLWPLLPESTRVLVDLGSGAGFPGLVLAILGVPEVHLFEADRRKATFLREAARQCGAAVTVHAERIEAADAIDADVVSARALAPLPKLLELAEPFVSTRTLCLFPKGKQLHIELTAAAEMWFMDVNPALSITEPDAAILRITKVCRHANP